ncbi:uncharacterized protein LOC117934481 isoform X2 [Vitis riparia]|uniref:uncharacterized protein LOC117934481 isoform X2 n=1 Tax=Vitis riparia TaxID=96939 RepID=UPI00155A0B90|nr:uncharacterized protein LOC117934481 isoform X2 [Vitis riparia]
MGVQLQAYFHHHHSRIMMAQPPLSITCGSSNSLLFNGKKATLRLDGSLGLHLTSRKIDRRRRDFGIVASSNVAAPFWDGWKPEKSSAAPSFSDILWPSAASSEVTHPSVTLQKYNMFMAQIGCAAIGVLAFSLLGPGWLARSTALGASIAFMIYTRSTHPPAASLPLLFIDGAKFHHLNFWYALFPGATACILLCLIQEIVCYLKQNFKF